MKASTVLIAESTNIAMSQPAPERVNLRDHIGDLNGTQMAYITIITDCPQYAKLEDGTPNPQFKNIIKESVVPIMLFNDHGRNFYQDKVNRQLIKEGKEADFSVSEAPWGYEELENCVYQFVKKDQTVSHYIRYIENTNSNNKKKTSYFVQNADGSRTPIEYSDLLRPKSRKVDSKSQGGISEKVEIRIVKLENVTRLAMNGKVLEGAFYYS